MTQNRIFPHLAISLATFTLLTVVALNCATQPIKDDSANQTASEFSNGARISIMTYNAENVFDTLHDEGKNDHTYLPLSEKKKPEIRAACMANTSEFRRQECLETDWNNDVLDEKLKRVADVIRQTNNGRGPDIQILVEIENENVLTLLNENYLRDSGYQTQILLEGPDARGIDPAILSRLPQWDQPRLHLIPFRNGKSKNSPAIRSRGILEARLLLPDGQKLSVFALHFPSQANPTQFRKQALDHLNQLMRELPADVMAIAGGDFNITSEEEKKRRYFKKYLAPEWRISHQEGCSECQGTHYYHPKRDWSFLDALLFSKSETWILDSSSIRIPKASRYQTNKYGSPARFDANSSIGVSDHWPIYAEIKKAN